MSDGAAAPGPDPVTRAVQQATMLADVGRDDDALTVINRARANDPDDQQLKLTAAWLHLRLDQPGEALPLLVAVAGTQPDAPHTSYLLSVAEAALDDLVAARTHADRTLQLAPESPRYHLQVALVVTGGKIRKADRALARARIASALELASEDASVARTAAELEWRMGDILAARALAKRALAIEPDNADLLYLDGALAGEPLPGEGNKEYSTTWSIADQVGSMGTVLTANPGHSQAGRVLFSRVWGQLLRVLSSPLVALGIVAIGIGGGMGDGPFVQVLYITGALALFWPLFWLFIAWAITSRSPSGYVRQQLRGGGGAGVRIAGTVVAAVVAVVGVACLFWLRDPILVRWLLVAIAVAALAGGAAAAAWVHRYLSSAEGSGVLNSSATGIAAAADFRRAMTNAVAWRLFVTLAAGILALMISSLTRADAAPVLMVVMLSWTAPVIYGALRARRVENRLRDAAADASGVADHGTADSTITPVATRGPGTVGGAVLGLVVLSTLAALVLALAQVPWAPSERDSHEAYQPHNGGSSECVGRPASRLACIIEMQQSPRPFPSITVPDIEVPDIEIPENLEP